MDILLAAAESLRMAEINEFHARAGKIQKLHVKRKRGVFRCEKCPSVFGLRHNLLRHERTIHQGRRPFKCDQPSCNASFVQRFDLETHRSSVHDKRKDHICQHCNRSFSQRSNLLTHIRLSHRNLSNSSCSILNVTSFFSCDQCCQNFQSKQLLKQHIRNQNCHSSNTISISPSASASGSQSPVTSTDMDFELSSSAATSPIESCTPVTSKLSNQNDPISYSSIDSNSINSIDSPSNLPALKPLPPHLSNENKLLN